MTPTTVVGTSGRERLGVIGIGALVVVTVGAYLALKSSVIESTATGNLLPYQALVRTLPSSDRTMFDEMQQQLPELEKVRAETGGWPDASALVQSVGRTVSGPPPATGGTLSDPPRYEWTRTREGFFVNYLARPSTDASGGAWLIVIQEPDPQAPPDPSPNDETHRRLPDGTVLHVTIWTHRFGGQVAPGFVRQPESAGWTQVLTAPVAPLARR